jgi:hypothetical protein
MESISTETTRTGSTRRTAVSYRVKRRKPESEKSIRANLSGQSLSSSLMLLSEKSSFSTGEQHIKKRMKKHGNKQWLKQSMNSSSRVILADPSIEKKDSETNNTLIHLWRNSTETEQRSKASFGCNKEEHDLFTTNTQQIKQSTEGLKVAADHFTSKYRNIFCNHKEQLQQRHLGTQQEANRTDAIDGIDKHSTLLPFDAMTSYTGTVDRYSFMNEMTLKSSPSRVKEIQDNWLRDEDKFSTFTEMMQGSKHQDMVLLSFHSQEEMKAT